MTDTLDKAQCFEADRDWMEKNMPLFMEQFNNCWIAVRDAQVIASEVDLGELLSKLSDLSYTCVEFISSTRDGGLN